MDILTIPEVDESRFPPSDGNSMPDIEDHRIQLSDLIFSLQLLTESWPNVHVGGNHFVYYNPDDPKDNCSPDVYVAIGVERRGRPAYYAWVERTFPQIVFEILSPNNTSREVADKLRLYAQQGVQEYYVIDPRRGPPTRLDGYIRHRNQLVLTPQTTPGSLRSELLGTELRVDEKWVRIVDPRTHGFIPTPVEITAARDQAELLRDQAEHLRDQARDERDQAVAARDQVEHERDQAVKAQQAAEAKLAALRAELNRLRQQRPDRH
jgi:Uma2 family endonuclease